MRLFGIGAGFVAMTQVFAGQVLAQLKQVEGGGNAAQAPAGTTDGAPAAQGGGEWMQLVLLGGIFAVFYFLIIRPQQKRAKQHREFISSIKVNDRVITNGGMYGRIVELDTATAVVELDKNCRVKVLRSYIAARQQEDETKDAEALREKS